MSQSVRLLKSKKHIRMGGTAPGSHSIDLPLMFNKMLSTKFQVVSGYQPPHPFEFLGFVLGEGIVILTFALMLSTRVAGMVGGVIAAILFGIAWMGGIVGGVGAAFHNATITNVGTLTKLILPTPELRRSSSTLMYVGCISSTKSWHCVLPR